MSTENTEITIHIDQDESRYDGDYDIKCEVTLSSPATDGKKITISYQGEEKEIVQDLVFKDIRAYLQDPKKWTKEYILLGDNDQEKLREYEVEIAQYHRSIKGHQESIEWQKQRLKKYEDAIAAIKAKMETHEQ